MQLLTELIEINKQLNMINEEQTFIEMLDALFEDLGTLKQLNLGRMINAFKQGDSYGNGFSFGHRSKLNTSSVGNKLAKYRGIGRDSEIADIGIIKNWGTIRREAKNAVDKNSAAQAVVLYANNKAVAVIVGSNPILEAPKKGNVVGLSWDFSGQGLTGEEVNKLIANLAVTPDMSFREKVTSSDSFKSEKTTTQTAGPWEKDQKPINRQYQGIAQTTNVVAEFVQKLAVQFGSKLTGKLVLFDKTQAEKQDQRRQNQPIDAKDIKLFKDDLKVRLAKYKNQKLDNIDDAKNLIEKVFADPNMKKFNFAGRTYTVDRNDRKTAFVHKGRSATYTDSLTSLLSGKEVTISFSGDSRADQYSSLYLSIILKNNSLVPTKVSYTDANGKHKEEKLA